jgi:hypothetical protein
LTLARDEKRPFAEVLQYFAMERFLYRLSCSPSADAFVLKGALMLRVWQSPGQRPTMDIDMLGRAPDNIAEIDRRMRSIIGVAVPADGLVFQPGDMRIDRIQGNAEYRGFRVRVPGRLTTARFVVQVDIGFGDAVHPPAKRMAFPVLLDHPMPSLWCYGRETTIAEKFQIMVKLDVLNSRMKDYYDVWLLSRQCAFAGDILAEAIRMTFDRRRTAMPTELLQFRALAAQSRQAQWDAFRRRLGRDDAPREFPEVAADLDAFLAPVATSIAEGRAFLLMWSADGGWRSNATP